MVTSYYWAVLRSTFVRWRPLASILTLVPVGLLLNALGVSLPVTIAPPTWVVALPILLFILLVQLVSPARL